MSSRTLALGLLTLALGAPAAWAAIPGDIAAPSAPQIAWPEGDRKSVV